MDDIARELLKVASILIESRVDIQARYDYWNRTVFDGKLPNVSVKWGRSKRWGGITKGMVNTVARTGTVNSIEVSDFIVDDPVVIDGILLHEMIHVEMMVQGKGGHGWEFSMLRRQYSSKSGINIPATEDMEHFVVPEDMEVKPKGVVVFHREGEKQGLVVYNLNFFQKSLDAIKSAAARFMDNSRRLGKKAEVFLLISDVKELLKYPEKRTVMNGWYMVPESLVGAVLSNGKELYRMMA
jgi:hypothetical protein